METLLVGLGAGFIIGVICVVWVLFRISRLQQKIEHDGSNLEQQEDSRSWIIMAVVSSSSIVWGLLGGVIYYFVKSHLYFMLFSFAVALIISAMLFLKDTRYKYDKIGLTLIITIGLGLLIPLIIQ